LYNCIPITTHPSKEFKLLENLAMFLINSLIIYMERFEAEDQKAESKAPKPIWPDSSGMTSQHESIIGSMNLKLLFLMSPVPNTISMMNG